MPNPENLKPAKKGEVRSTGRPKGSPNRSTLLKKWLKLKVTFPNRNEETDEKVFEEKDFDFQITLHDAVMLALIQKAQSGDVAAIKEVQDTIYGKMPTVNELTGKDGNPIETLHRVIKPKTDDSNETS